MAVRVVLSIARFLVGASGRVAAFDLAYSSRVRQMF
jgi:hypothetical protein